MANNLNESNAAVNAKADALCALLNTGYLRIYDGTQPATADTALTSQVLLAELRFGATAFGASAAGVATANAITAEPNARSTSTATWFRALKSDGTSAVFDGTVGTSGCDLNLDRTDIQSGGTVAVTGLTYTQPK